MRPVPRYVYGVDRKGAKSGLIAPHGSVEMDGIAHWMGNEHFYSYNGVVTPMACDVHKYVFDDINRGQASKVFGGVNKAYREMIWFYPSAASIECDRFVAYSADKGEKLYEIRTGKTGVAPPITYEIDGKQYVAFMAGAGRPAGTVGPNDAKVDNPPMLFVFSLDGKAEMPAAVPPPAPAAR